MVADKYLTEVVGSGDEVSDMLAQIFDGTLSHSRLEIVVQQKGMGGLKALRIPKGNLVCVHSLGADPREENNGDYATSLVERLVASAKSVGATPVGFTNVIASRKADKEYQAYIREAAEAMADALVKRDIPCINGEYAVLGPIVNFMLNTTGTMISTLPKSPLLKDAPFIFEKDGIQYAVFDPGEELVVANSDGEGTKSQFNLLAGKPQLGVFNAAAMNLDDTIKSRARARVLTMVVETNSANFNLQTFKEVLYDLGSQMGFTGILQGENVSNRILGDRLGLTYNIDGCVVATIREDMFRNPIQPHAGQSLVAVRGYPINWRSNGATFKREVMPKMFGRDWEKRPEGKMFLEYLCAPSTILYPHFRELIERNLATAVYHMSGGAFKGKLAKPLAKHGLYAHVGNLFTPDYRELALLGAGLTPAQNAYAKSSMNTDGFVATYDPKQVIEVLSSRRLEARDAGKIEVKTILKPGRGYFRVTGVDIDTYNGENVNYTWETKTDNPNRRR